MNPRDAAGKDYYAALGVAKDATAADIKKAYRTLARDLHPDSGSGDEEKFKVVSEAYDVLSDDARRKDYDEARSLMGPGGRGAAGMPFDLGDLLGRGGGGGGGFGDVLGGLFGGRAGARARPERGADVPAEVTLAFLDALRGVTVPLRLSTTGACQTCRGSGAAPGTAPRACDACGGQGMTSRDQGAFAFAEPCSACRGSGRVVDTPCPGCRGTGSERRDTTLQVRIPAGVSDGGKVRLSGRGGPGQRGGPAGDLLVTVHVSPHPLFTRRGEHVAITVPVTFAEAALGAQVTVPTPGGDPVTVKVAPGTASGQTLRVRGRGVPSRTGVGDLLVTLQVDVPTNLSDEARAHLEAFAAAAPADVRAHLAST